MGDDVYGHQAYQKSVIPAPPNDERRQQGPKRLLIAAFPTVLPADAEKTSSSRLHYVHNFKERKLRSVLSYCRRKLILVSASKAIECLSVYVLTAQIDRSDGLAKANSPFN